MEKILSIIIGITFIFANTKEGDIGFRYGFLSKPSYDSDSLIVLSDSSIIHTGDFLKINIGYKNKTNFCIAYRVANGEYMSLYNYYMQFIQLYNCLDIDHQIEFQKHNFVFRIKHIYLPV